MLFLGLTISRFWIWTGDIQMLLQIYFQENDFHSTVRKIYLNSW